MQNRLAVWVGSNFVLVVMNAVQFCKSFLLYYFILEGATGPRNVTSVPCELSETNK